MDIQRVGFSNYGSQVRLSSRSPLSLSSESSSIQLNGRVGGSHPVKRIVASIRRFSSALKWLNCGGSVW